MAAEVAWVVAADIAAVAVAVMEQLAVAAAYTLVGIDSVVAQVDAAFGTYAEAGAAVNTRAGTVVVVQRDSDWEAFD